LVAGVLHFSRQVDQALNQRRNVVIGDPVISELPRRPTASALEAASPLREAMRSCPADRRAFTAGIGLSAAALYRLAERGAAVSACCRLAEENPDIAGSPMTTLRR